VRILVDYRPALRARTGVGEYVHEMVRALAGPRPDATEDEVAIFTSSWKDRPNLANGRQLPGIRIIDRRVPVSVLALAWNRLGWPPVETMAGPSDVVHAASPLLIPTRRAARVSTIHDLHFLRHPERLSAEMRRDFPPLVFAHASAAEAIVVSSAFARQDVITTLGVAPERVYLCPPGVPPWAETVRARRQAGGCRHILSLGTLEPRKNLDVLLDAYAALRSRTPSAPPLVLAGGVGQGAASLVDRIGRSPLGGHVTVTGYVSDAQRETLLAEAHMLVMTSLDEGFGLPALEAMASGVPVVVSSGGSLPEVVGVGVPHGAEPAATPVDSQDAEGFAREMAALLDADRAGAAQARGLRRARDFDWTPTIATLRTAYRDAMSRR
jgi:glycosyltransferase involved in cell wall biosynthesis